METFWSLKKWWASCCWFLCSQPNPVASLEQQKGPLFLPALDSFHWLCVGDKQRSEVQRGSDVWGEAGPSAGLHELTEQLLIGHLCWVPFFFCTTVLCLHLLVWELWQQTLHTLPTSSCPSFWQSWQSEFQFYLPSEAQWPELLLPLQLSGHRFWGWEGSPEAVVREVGETQESSVLEKLNAEGVPRRGSAAVQCRARRQPQGAWRWDPASADCLPILALSLIHWASHALLLASFFPSVSEEIELAYIHVPIQIPKFEIFTFLLFGIGYKWLRLTLWLNNRCL